MGEGVVALEDIVQKVESNLVTPTVSSTSGGVEGLKMLGVRQGSSYY